MERVKSVAIFGFHDVAEVMMNGFEEPGTKATDEEKRNYKNLQKLDIKAKFVLYQCVGPKIFNKISKAATAKEGWEILMKMYGDDDKNKKVKWQTLRRQIECICMDESETISEYFDKIQEIVNAMRTSRDTIIDQQVVDKILRTLPQRFDHIVMTIEETKDLEEMELEAL